MWSHLMKKSLLFYAVTSVLCAFSLHWKVNHRYSWGSYLLLADDWPLSLALEFFYSLIECSFCCFRFHSKWFFFVWRCCFHSDDCSDSLTFKGEMTTRYSPIAFFWYNSFVMTLFIRALPFLPEENKLSASMEHSENSAAGPGFYFFKRKVSSKERFSQFFLDFCDFIIFLHSFITWDMVLCFDLEWWKHR